MMLLVGRDSSRSKVQLYTIPPKATLLQGALGGLPLVIADSP
jgi:hypothetical protein